MGGGRRSALEDYPKGYESGHCIRIEGAIAGKSMAYDSFGSTASALSGYFVDTVAELVQGSSSGLALAYPIASRGPAMRMAGSRPCNRDRQDRQATQRSRWRLCGQLTALPCNRTFAIEQIGVQRQQSSANGNGRLRQHRARNARFLAAVKRTWGSPGHVVARCRLSVQRDEVLPHEVECARGGRHKRASDALHDAEHQLGI